MSNYQYKPDLSVHLAPRVPRRLRIAVNRLCKRYEMPEADILRYSFEALVLTVHRRGRIALREPIGNPPLDSMASIRTSKIIAKMTREIHQRQQRRFQPLLFADVLRTLIYNAVRMAEEKGLAHLMALRENGLARC